MNKQRGFTIFELVFVIAWLAALGVGVTLLYWVIRALIKYVGA